MSAAYVGAVAYQLRLLAETSVPNSVSCALVLVTALSGCFRVDERSTANRLPDSAPSDSSGKDDAPPPMDSGHSGKAPPTPTLLVDALADPVQLVSDADHLYFIGGRQNETYGLRRVRKDGSEQEILAGGEDAGCFALDDQAIFWADTGSPAGVARVHTAKKAGGAPVDLAPQPGAGRCVRMAVDQTFVYWTIFDTGEVWRVEKTGGTPALVASEQDFVFGIAVDESDVFWTRLASPPEGPVMRWDKDLASAPARLWPSPKAAGNDILLEGGFVYVIVDRPTYSLLRVPRDGSSEPKVLQEASLPLGYLAKDARYVYTSWGNVASDVYPNLGGPVRIYGVPLQGQALWTLDLPPDGCLHGANTSLAIDDTYLFWTELCSPDPVNGSIWRVEKPEE
jgi:hypothetical protein